MTETVRCPSCRGSKKVPKLGGMIGDCNTCEGEGFIKAADKVKPVMSVPEASPKEIISAVADSIPCSTVDTPDVKVDGKKALYRRKK